MEDMPSLSRAAVFTTLIDIGTFWMFSAPCLVAVTTTSCNVDWLP